MENWMVFVNDLMSFYKEFDDPRDQTSLVNNYCQCEGISINEALDKLVYDVIHSSEQIYAVFEEKDGQIRDTLVSFIQGYTTWHLVDPRYRLKEVYKEVGNTPAEEKFSKYCEMAKKVGAVDPAEWAYPSVVALVGRKANQPRKVTVLQKMRSWKPAFVLPALPVIFLVLFSFSFLV
jgi:trichodiene synthase